MSLIRLDQKVYQNSKRHLAKKFQTENLPSIWDKNLTLREHANYLTKKLIKFCGFFNKIRHIYQRKFLLQFYHAYVTSVIKNGLLNYGSTRKTHLENIYKAQRRIIRAKFFKKPQNSFCEILTKYTIFIFYELYILEVVNEVLKQLKSTPHVPTYPQTLTMITTRGEKQKAFYQQPPTGQ